MKVLDYDGLEYYNTLIENKYLPKSGGTMTGRLTMSNGQSVEFGADHSDGTGGFVAKTGTGIRIASEAFGYTAAGGYIDLDGQSIGTANAGRFVITARSSSSTANSLIGKPDGTLTWGGNSIALGKDYLPLSGGTMTGSIQRNGDLAVGINDSAYIQMYGGTGYDHGAWLQLVGKNHSEAGRFILQANDGTNRRSLVGTSSGNLTWLGDEIARDVKTGTSNGTISVNGSNVSVKGLGSAAYTASSAYATASHTHSYLPLSGGTLTGTIIQNHGGNTIRGKTNGSVLIFCGGQSAEAENGAKLYLHGSTSSSDPGEFNLQAGNSSGTYSQLIGTPTGSLTWKGNNVMTAATTGVVVSKSISSAVSVSATTAKTITSVSLPAGVWVITGHANFGSTTANHMYGIELNYSNNFYRYSDDTSVAAQSSSTRVMALQTSGVFTLTATKNVYLCAYTSVAASVADAQIYAVRIK